MDTPFPPARLAPPLMPEGRADAPLSVPAHPPFFRVPGSSPPAFDPLPTGRLKIGRRAAVAGDFDIAALAFLCAANAYRLSRQPIFEAYALVELAAVYQLQKRFERLPALARRTRSILGLWSLPPDQAAIVQLAAELIETAPEAPTGLQIFGDCWHREKEPGERIQPKIQPLCPRRQPGCLPEPNVPARRTALKRPRGTSAGRREPGVRTATSPKRRMPTLSSASSCFGRIEDISFLISPSGSQAFWKATAAFLGLVQERRLARHRLALASAAEALAIGDGVA